MRTLRQEMMVKLKEDKLDIRGLSQALGIREKEVIRHLPHVAKSAKAKGMAFEIQPAYCENCHFSFEARQRLSPPSKCPQCRQSRIQGPWYKIAVSK